MLREHIDIPSFICATLSFGGIVCVVRPGFIFGYDEEVDAATTSWIPIFAALFGAIGQAFVYVIVRKLKDIHFLVIVHYFLLMSIVGSLAFIVVVQQVRLGNSIAVGMV